MVHRKSWGHIVAIVILGLAVMCAPASSQQFSAPKNVSANADFSFTPQLAVDLGGNIYVVWEDDTNTNNNILFSRSTDSGATFSAPKNLSNSSGFSFSPRIATDTHGGINVVWEDATPGNLDVMFSHSTDGGLTFSTPINVSNDAADSSALQIIADTAGNLFVAWENDTLNLAIIFSRSTDGGVTFSTPARVSANAGASVSPQMAVDPGGNISVVWVDVTFGHSDISFSRSADHGATFSTPKSLSNNIGSSVNPQITVDLTGNINVAWENNGPGNFDIFFSRSVDKGATFSTPKNLSNSLGQSRSPQIALDAGGNINVVWTDNNPPDVSPDILFVRSSDGGTTFSAAQNVSHNSGSSSNPWLSVDAGANINVAWEDNTPGNQDIFFARSTDSGATFSTPVNLSEDSGLSSEVQVAPDKNGNINVAWQDNTPGSSQILFSRFSSGVVANHPPVAVAGPDQTVQSTGNGGTVVQLDGSKSSDPDGDVLSFVWKDETNTVVGTTAAVQLTLSLGTHTFALTVSDPGGLSSTARTLITIQAVNHPPFADAGADQTPECAGHGGTSVMLNGSESSDPDGDALSFVWKNEANNVVGTTAVVPLTLTGGAHTFTLTVTDPGGLTAAATTHVTVRDTAPPAMRVTLSPDDFWSHHHKFVQITASVEVTDSCDASPVVALVSITSNERNHGHGDGDDDDDDLDDIRAVGGGPIPFGTDVRSFLLRAERSRRGSGRVIYTVTYMARDASGNVSLASAQVSAGSQTTEESRERSHRKKKEHRP